MSHARPVETILFAGGGTGGHLFPGVALAEEFQRRDPQVRIVFAGTRRGLEARVIPQLGYPLVFLEVHGLVGIGGRRRLKALLSFPRALVQALILLVRYRPSLIVGLGGYASAPVLLAAMIGGIPWVLQEQNAFPGLVNRLLAPFARAVFIAFDDAGKHLHSRRIYNCGNPLRCLAGTETEDDGEAGNRDPEIFTLLVIGGSQGARVLNQVVPAAFGKLASRYPGLRVVHQSGIAEFEKVRKAYSDFPDRVEVVDFINDIGRRYREADLVVCRAGALTLAELAQLGKAAILVPFPHAAHDHQVYNARAFAAAGAARVRCESEFDENILAADIEELIEDRERLAVMADAARSLARPAAREEIVDHCLKLIEEG
ncbi:MAG: undecaprenyldiphospho-muramoylpentapeptide beta-N-acetylglucosaminyltransferase [Deltaproteobacteria bacterium]|nr:undecaprenyldiphospho-muramoylpentapeptide beta-N-acetylglucosaminyltransferase [Deltaproteobacteria bacterium]